MIEYPITIELEASMNASDTSWETKTPYDELQVGITPDFDGDADVSSPEGLYGLALLNCYLATFQKLASYKRLQYDTVEAKGELTVERDDDGNPWLAACDMTATVLGCDDKDACRKLHEQVQGHCFIHRSVKTAISIELVVT